jgi:hypothetical protein
MLLRRKTVADVEKVESLKEQAYDMLSTLISSATQAGEFIKDQIPLVIQELLAFNTALYIAGVVASAGAFACLLWAFRYCMRKHQANEWSDWIGGAIFSGIGAIASLAGLAVAVVHLLKITLAPRVWLIEYAAEMVR